MILLALLGNSAFTYLNSHTCDLSQKGNAIVNFSCLCVLVNTNSNAGDYATQIRAASCCGMGLVLLRVNVWEEHCFPRHVLLRDIL